uniref:dUTPase-like domain-containing protein n=1 Tax=Pelusios castaneus TaxID=367368 RepID=A0A8C8R513_9SAUR
ECRSTKNPATRPLKKCPKCQKGFHWANQCRSSGNGNSGRGSAGLDLILQADTDFQLPGEVHMIPTQVTGPLPPQMVGLILPRSHAGRKGFFVIPGVVDADYTGVLKVQVWTNLPQRLPRGSSIAQLILVPYSVLGVESRERGTGGFGSTLPINPSVLALTARIQGKNRGNGGCCTTSEK